MKSRKRHYDSRVFSKIKVKNEKPNVKTTTTIGYLNPISWDEDGNPVHYSIYTFEEEDILIESKLLSEQLAQKIKNLRCKNVEARGVIKKNDYGEKSIKLHTIKELKTNHFNFVTAKHLYTDDVNLLAPNIDELEAL